MPDIKKVMMYPVKCVNVYSMSEKRLHNVHVTPGAGQGQGALSLLRNGFGVCTLEQKIPKTQGKMVHLVLIICARLYGQQSLTSNLFQ